MKIISESNLLAIIRATAAPIDPRLIAHGERVAFILYKMMQAEKGYSPKQRKDICILGLLHDIGAYKTEEIDRMVVFESHDVWEHSIYGYIFLKAFSPLGELCDSVLYHHLAYDLLRDSSCRNKDIAEKIHLADRVDILVRDNEDVEINGILSSLEGQTFSDRVVELFYQADREFGIVNSIKDKSAMKIIRQAFSEFTFTYAELGQYLHMLVNFIDFRSEFTVAHTMMTVQFSVEIARLMKLSRKQQEKIYWGAQFHDLGKIAIPTEILEKPGGLTTEEMEIMKLHVVYSREFLVPFLDAEILEIAVRHHEKPDGSGYPDGLTAEQLTTEQRILAVADVLSALLGKRSYKESFDKEATLGVLNRMAQNRKLCPEVVGVVNGHFDEIVACATKYVSRDIDEYNHFWEEFNSLRQHIGEAYPETNREQQR